MNWNEYSQISRSSSVGCCAVLIDDTTSSKTVSCHDVGQVTDSGVLWDWTGWVVVSRRSSASVAATRQSVTIARRSASQRQYTRRHTPLSLTDRSTTGTGRSLTATFVPSRLTMVLAVVASH